MTAFSNQTKHQYVAVRFRYGDPASPTYTRYTDYPSAITGPDGSSFASRPQMAVAPISYSGGLGEQSVKITMELGSTGSFTDLISNGQPHSPVRVDIWEVVDPSPAVPAAQTLHLFCGDLQIATRNAEGESQVIELEASNAKSHMEIPMGIPALPHCPWAFCGRGCFYSPVGLSDTGTLTGVDASDGKKATITGLGAQAGRYWHRGYVEYDGLRIGIRDWVSTDATTFYLVIEPPTGWIGESVSVFPGCDKQIDTCRNRWANEEHFGGFGIAIPAYHPVVEDGAS